MAVSHEKFVALIGDVNGVNRNFTTSAPLIAGTERAFINGVMYPEDDGFFGWIRISTTEVQFFNAPQTGWDMRLFIQEAEPQGSPFHPDER